MALSVFAENVNYFLLYLLAITYKHPIKSIFPPTIVSVWRLAKLLLISLRVGTSITIY